MTAPSLRKIVIYGGGLAGYICACALSHVLPRDIEILLIDRRAAEKTDLFFGTLTSPASYDFLLKIGLKEPELLLQTDTNFALGTRYENWGPEGRGWTQSFYRPLPVFNGVDFHHYLTRLRRTDPPLSALEEYIMSTEAARKGRFAHPPEERKTPLADMEYGYQFRPSDWARFFSDAIDEKRVTRLYADILGFERDGDDIRSITLEGRHKVEADLFIDAAGPQSKLRPKANINWIGTRKLRAVETTKSETGQRDICRVVTAADYGWQSATTLQRESHRLTLYATDSEDAALIAHGTPNADPVEAGIGRDKTPWTGNCLRLGHSAAIIEPLTPAPIMLLERDINRLLELIPVSKDMTVERREYNRRFTDDYSHAELFHDAFFFGQKDVSHPYWRDAAPDPENRRLTDKIAQFESRGVLVQYDYEPFNKENWTLLHVGMGRVPQRYDPLADRVSIQELKSKLAQMRQAIEIMGKKLPLQDVYMSRLLQYLKGQNA